MYPLFSFIHLAVCLTTGPKRLPNRALHIVRLSPQGRESQGKILDAETGGSQY
jgi:hypothetical protein